MYLSDDGEPDLSGLVQLLWARNEALAGQRQTVATALPVTDPAPAATMSFRVWYHDDDLQPGRFGIAVPPEREPVIPEVVLVPLVMFDAAGNRLGRGAGFYDRWLNTYDAVAIGVAFECQRSREVPVEDHDVALDAIVTEVGLRYP